LNLLGPHNISNGNYTDHLYHQRVAHYSTARRGAEATPGRHQPVRMPLVVILFNVQSFSLLTEA
jgi:hypothetical protein